MIDCKSFNLAGRIRLYELLVIITPAPFGVSSSASNAPSILPSSKWQRSTPRTQASFKAVNCIFRADSKSGSFSTHLEILYVDISEEFVALIVHQRGFQANTRTITTADEMIQETEVPAEHLLKSQFEKWDALTDGIVPDGRLDAEEIGRFVRDRRRGSLQLGRLFELIEDRLELLEGEVRLLAWTDQEPGELVFHPNSSQFETRMLVLAA